MASKKSSNKPAAAKKPAKRLKRSARRQRVAGNKLPRKVYPRITAEQKKAGLAPAMEGMINRQNANLEDQGNRPGALDKQLRMSHNKAKGSLRRPWGTAITKSTGSKNVMKLMDSRGLARRKAMSAIKDATKVSFGADPFPR